MGTPIVGDLGTAFSIRPATGTVEAFSSLDCEVVFHPSFSAPEDGEFSLQVVGAGASPAAASQQQQLQQHLVAPLKLRCVARPEWTDSSTMDRDRDGGKEKNSRGEKGNVEGKEGKRKGGKGKRKER